MFYQSKTTQESQANNTFGHKFTNKPLSGVFVIKACFRPIYGTIRCVFKPRFLYILTNNLNTSKSFRRGKNEASLERIL